MFDVGFWELVLIGVVALVVVGPERLPRIARVAGLWLGRARRVLGSVKAEIDRELKADELREILRKQAASNPLETIMEEPRAPSSRRVGAADVTDAPVAAVKPESPRDPMPDQPTPPAAGPSVPDPRA